MHRAFAELGGCFEKRILTPLLTRGPRNPSSEVTDRLKLLVSP
jgi:hypothetical protein